MPIFDYICKQCDAKIEKQSDIDARDDQKCECGSDLQRVLSFKGMVFSATCNGGMK